MRELTLKAAMDTGHDIAQTVGEAGGSVMACWQSVEGSEASDIVVVHVTNSKVEGLVAALERFTDLEIVLPPRGVIVLKPPSGQAPEEVREVELRSPVEVYLGGLQSVGSWRGFLGYALIAGVVVWVGLYTNTIYLVVAAMLIAPFGGPAMNAAVATARGDLPLLGRALLRYFVSLATTAAVAGALSWLFNQSTATSLMVETSLISSAAATLPLAAGAAGALNLIQSERSSLVSGAATGMLVAAALAPPAGLVGMGTAIGQWPIVGSALFLLMLQLVGINLSGALIFRLAGLSARGARYNRGRTGVAYLASVVTVAALVALVTFQLWDSPNLQRSTTARHAEASVRDVLRQFHQVDTVDVRTTFPDVSSDYLLTLVYLTGAGEERGDASALEQQIQTALQRRLLAEYDVVPVVYVQVLESPAGPE